MADQMMCPRCCVALEVGKALYPYEAKGVRSHFKNVGTADTIKLIDVWKCPKCGYSDDPNATL